ncbi:MAG TPA: hypothetical protein VJ761_01095, partial [Ktedonobacteraceae bacterium]|nr:hypothetical protein [Ktedonobacteraceae bacterium]
VIGYHLLPEDNPTHPERVWWGRIIKQCSCQQSVWVESLEEGYEGETEPVLLAQIVTIEGEGAF